VQVGREWRYADADGGGLGGDHGDECRRARCHAGRTSLGATLL